MVSSRLMKCRYAIPAHTVPLRALAAALCWSYNTLLKQHCQNVQLAQRKAADCMLCIFSSNASLSSVQLPQHPEQLLYLHKIATTDE